MKVYETSKNIHPGEILLEEFLKPMGLSAYRLSKDTGIPQPRISAIIKGNRAITTDTALRLSKYFGVGEILAWSPGRFRYRRGGSSSEEYS